ncbi:MAG: MFS transporter, partial [Anaerolineales bacterium]|nr:MFS transporter [Anaerolineales bacterium]
AHLVQRRLNATVDHLRPQRWNWTAVLQPLDRSLARQSEEPLPFWQVRSLRFFWLDGLFAAISENFYLGFVALFALAYGASNGQIGWLTAMTNLLGALSLFPGARLVERSGRRKPIVVWSGGGLSRLPLLLFALLPLLFLPANAAILLIIAFSGLRAFFSNLSNPAWTALAADLVPDAIRGRYFSSRNMVMGVAALVVAPLAGRLITQGNAWADSTVFGYQIIFLLAFLSGVVSTLSYQRIDEPPPTAAAAQPHQPGDTRRMLRQAPWFAGLIVSSFVWNMALQIAGPFFNVYLVNELAATTTTVGLLAAVSSLTALAGQRLFGRMMDRRSAFWVMQLSGFLIPLAPFAWMFVTAPWQVGLINTFAGFLWAGYNLASFSLLLTLTPDAQRPRAVALYQTAVFASAVLGPILGGYLADAVSYRLIFGLSGAGRLLGMLLFVWLTVRPYRRQLP